MVLIHLIITNGNLESPTVIELPSIEPNSYSVGHQLFDNTVIIGTNKGTLHVVDSMTGDVIRSQNLFKEDSMPVITSICSDNDHIYVSTDEKPIVYVFSIGTLVGKTQASPILEIQLAIPSIQFPIIIKSLLRPGTTHLITSGSLPTGSLYVQTDRIILRYSFESESVACFDVFESRNLLAGPFDNGPLMSIEYGSDKFCTIESIGSRYRVSSDVRINNLFTATVSPARDKPRIWTLRFDDSSRRILLGSWGLRNGVSPTSGAAAACF